MTISPKNFARPGLAALTACAVLLSAATAQATTMSWRGSFTGDADVQRLDFTLASAGDIELKTLSYAGGTQADGTVLSAGGFDPILSLFDSTGDLLHVNDDGYGVGVDPVTFNTWDSRIVASLGAGDYFVTITQYDNFPVGTNFSDGFWQTDSDFTGWFGCSNGMFCDAGAYNRTGAWAVDLAPVPLPATLPLALAGLAALGAIGRRRTRA